MPESLEADYVPQDSEPFMNPRQREYFRKKLLNWKNEILRESRETLETLQGQTDKLPDMADRASSETDPSKSLFELIERILTQNGLELAQMASIIYCEGPGSMLGVRTAVMAIRAWEGIGITAAANLYTYNSLALGRQIVGRSTFAAQSCLLVTDARRDSWNTLPHPDPDNTLNSQLMATDELASEDRVLITFPQFSCWNRTEIAFDELDYDPTASFEDELYLQIIRPVERANPLSVRLSDYKKWIPKIHSAAEQ